MGKRNKNKTIPSKKPKNFDNNLKTLLKTKTNKQTTSKPVKSEDASTNLRNKMQEKLKASRFRYLNEQMYTSKGKDAKKLFKNDPESFTAYHKGYRQQVERWPLNPLDVIIESITQMKNLRNLTIVDFGCGDARLAQTIKNRVNQIHSFDLVAINPNVTECDMSNCPLQTSSVDVAVYCLSLMGTNLKEYLIEANRLLRYGGILKIADVESRFKSVDKFVEQLKRYGFTLQWKDFSCNMFYFLDFRKDQNIRNKDGLPVVSLQPCLYKKR